MIFKNLVIGNRIFGEFEDIILHSYNLKRDSRKLRSLDIDQNTLNDLPESLKSVSGKRQSDKKL